MQAYPLSSTASQHSGMMLVPARAICRGFTIVEVLVVAAVIAILLSILLPSLMHVRRKAQTAQCLYNMKQLALAANSYAVDARDCLPYPVGSRPINGQSKQDEGALWFTALDKYLVTPRPDDPSRSGIAGERAYRKWKECVVWQGFRDDPAKPPVNTSQTVKEYSRTIKMNSHLRRLNGDFARLADVDRPAEMVLFGDGTSIDQVEWPTNTYETGQFSFDVNGSGVGGIALRHGGAANVAFVDGHASTESLPSYQRQVGSTTIRVPSWQCEFINASQATVYNGVDGKKSMEAQGLRRNPAMPLVWSQPGRLYRP